MRSPSNDFLPVSSLFIFTDSREEGMDPVISHPGIEFPNGLLWNQADGGDVTSGKDAATAGSSSSWGMSTTPRESFVQGMSCRSATSSLIRQSTVEQMSSSSSARKGSSTTCSASPKSRRSTLQNVPGSIFPVSRSDHVTATSIPAQRKIFFMTVHDVTNTGSTSTILKVTSETTTNEVIEQALKKTGKINDKVHEYVLVEEVADTWDKKKLKSRSKKSNKKYTHRILGESEHPLFTQSVWMGEGKIYLRKISDDPSTRAWLATIKAASLRRERMVHGMNQRELNSRIFSNSPKGGSPTVTANKLDGRSKSRTRTGDESDGRDSTASGSIDDGNEGMNQETGGGSAMVQSGMIEGTSNIWTSEDTPDLFLVCIYNVSPNQPYTVLKAFTTSTATEVVQMVRYTHIDFLHFHSFQHNVRRIQILRE